MAELGYDDFIEDRALTIEAKIPNCIFFDVIKIIEPLPSFLEKFDSRPFRIEL